jgi:glycosyltransferase involved in cell wall biosynthesis
VSGLLEEYFEYAYEAGAAALPLVLVGDKLFENKLHKGFEKMLGAGAGRVVQTGFVDEAELAAYYAECCAFVHLSREEGFNLPVLEAANCGAPLILSDIEVHKEVAGDAAVFVDLNDKGAAADAMKAMLDDSVRDKFSEKSLELAKRYSWKKSARLVMDVLYSL